MRWVTFCRVLCLSEASLAAALNIFVLFTLWKRRIDANATTYRIGITVICLSAIGQSLLECFAIVIHQIHDNEYTLILLGPVEFLGEDGCEILAQATLVFSFFMWEWIPASCILQYLALCRQVASCSLRPHYSNTRRLLFAYGYCLVIICVSSPFVRTFINEKTWQPHVHAVVREIQDIPEDELVFAYAATSKEIAENNNRTVIPFVLIATLPSYAWSYGAFIVTITLIWLSLRSYGTKLSEKTAQMQRRFLRMLMIQGLVPLAVTAVPVTIFIGTMVAGLSMDRWSIIHSAAINAVPIVQAMVSYRFVHSLRRKSAPSSSNKNEAAEPTAAVWNTNIQMETGLYTVITLNPLFN